MALRLLVLALCVTYVASHAAMFIPSPRNANDRVLPQFANGRSPIIPCTCANGVGGKNASKEGCDRGVRSEGDGQVGFVLC